MKPDLDLRSLIRDWPDPVSRNQSDSGLARA